MYSTCIHCHAALGSNDTIEHFPVGQRLAFDAAKGRLWVVCRRCRRWNLTPLEERWEAIEECERRFRGTTLRASTDNIGLARLDGGTELVRVGNPLRPEMAAWRYAGNFRRRWLTHGVPAAVASSAITFLQFGQAFVGIGVGIGSMVAIGATMELYNWRHRRARVAHADGRVVTLGMRAVKSLHLLPVGDGWGITSGKAGDVVTTGPLAVHTLRIVATARNFKGAREPVVADALSLLAQAGDPARFITKLARASERTGLHGHSPDVAIALEMALHDDVERRALDGELSDLKYEWETAEEIAKLSDNMFLPSSVAARLESVAAEARRDAR